MKKLFWLLAMMMTGVQQAFAFNIDKFMDSTVAPVSDKIADIIFTSVPLPGGDVPLIILWILFAGVFFTIYFKGVAIWGLKHAVEQLVKPANSGDGS